MKISLQMLVPVVLLPVSVPAMAQGFGSQQVITADGAVSVYATDLDGDGDADVLSASSGDGKIALIERLAALVPPPRLH
jgi:hypothetical protein